MPLLVRTIIGYQLLNRREQLEAALAHAKAHQARLEADLARAMAELNDAVSDASKVGADRAEASARVEIARDSCRHLNAELTEFRRSDYVDRARLELVKWIRESHERLKRNAVANPPAQRPRAPEDRGAASPTSDADRGRRKTFVRFTNARSAVPNVRGLIGLLGLTLAYLQFYFLDVQVQVLRLPTLVVFLHGNLG